MKRLQSWYSALLFVILWPSPGFGGDPSPSPLPLAVLEFHAAKELEPDFGLNAATLLNAMLSAEPDLWLVERAELDKGISEQELGLAGNVTPETAARVGQLTGAKVLVTGRVFRAGKETVLVTKIIGTETGRVFGEIAKSAGSANASDLVNELAAKVAATLRARRDSLVAVTINRDDRLAAVKSKLPEGPRPTVRVNIPERHFGAPVVDPAAETEVIRWLTSCGFAVLDAKAKETPDLEIVGEAFSAFALRKGNMICCRARVEIKVTRTTDQRVMLSDARAGMAVDIAEQTAAKESLMETTAMLMERIITQLSN